LAWNCGSVPEIIDPGITDFIVTNEEEAVQAIQRAPELDGRQIRKVFERSFTAHIMAEAHVKVSEGVRGMS